MLTTIYLLSIVVANLAVTFLGPSYTPVIGFLLVRLDITARDALHKRWKGRHLWLKMAALIAAGALLSWMLNRQSASVALASMVAFAASGAVDALVYHLLHRWSRSARINGSNAVAALVDSILFPLVAFGALMPGVVLGQMAAKIAGGLVWGLILSKGAAAPHVRLGRRV